MRLFVFADQSLALGRSLNVWRVFREAVKGAACCNYQTNRQIKIHDMLTHLKSWRQWQLDVIHTFPSPSIFTPPQKSGYRRRLYLHVCSEPAGLESPVLGRAGLFCKALSSWVKTSRKKAAILLDFVQIRGGRVLPNFLPPFHKCVFGQ